ncbi:hypothetical protein BS47DRAFT_1372531 [Hydnum rufescens UP504]|uniref:Glycosyltransferase family 18 catalytic domain-containing protein n=1 Tax=Hydnum rufescens UP504 TaxID=1448309 RepID=A0A9P6DW85_9AGAM|nr:hypothetical protein BS47DRAFT_1372531 [Hydnum rufescens UP504]
MRALLRCLESSNCRKNQDKVVLLGSFHFRLALRGQNGGEQMWARSTTHALRNMGYSYFFISTTQQMVQLYQIFPHLVKAIIQEGSDVEHCRTGDEFCILRPDHPEGIPIWKLFSFSFWMQSNHFLGPQWTLNPEPWYLGATGITPNTYLGYSVEPSCTSRPVVPHSERHDQAYVMAKMLRFFLPGPTRAWSFEDYDVASNASGVRFIVGAGPDPWHDPKEPIVLPDSLTNLGRLPQTQFIDAVAHSKVMIGVGEPSTSPTPYEALCLGVPFINPWDTKDPTNRNTWLAQHGLLKLLDPPYVYNVFSGDQKGFAKAIKDAIAHPIDRHILDRMKMTSVEDRCELF